MSAEHVGWAFRQNVGNPTRKLVLVALADRINKDTLICRPHMKTLAADCNLSERSVQRALGDLCELRLIQRRRRRRQDGSLAGYDYAFRDLSSPPDTLSGSPPDTLSGHEPEVVLEPKPLAAAPRAKSNGKVAADAVWDALTDIFGAPTTRSAETLRGKIVASLNSAGATPSEIERRAKTWPSHFDSATLTPSALEKHWDTLGRPPLRRTR